MSTFSDTSDGPAASDEGLLDPLTMRKREVQHISPPGKLYRGLTSSIRLLPDFMVIGTQRGGTTSLYHYLSTHPNIRMSATTDTHFFDKKYNKGLAWYRGHFPTSIERYFAQRLRKQPFLTGEACSSYLYYPHTPKRVANSLPAVKLIVLLRNPVDRAYSQYFHAVEMGHETLTFEEAIAKEEERIAAERAKILANEQYFSNKYINLSYLSRGIYIDQLQSWMELFPREQFLIFKSEDYYADPINTFKKVLTFLNVPYTEPKVNKKEYKQYSHNTYFSQMDAGLRNRLIEYFEPFNARLYDFLGIEFDWDK